MCRVDCSPVAWLETVMVCSIFICLFWFVAVSPARCPPPPKATGKQRGLPLVFLGQKHGGNRPVRLSDHVHPVSAIGDIDGKNPVTGGDGRMVGLNVLLLENAPIPRDVAGDAIPNPPRRTHFLNPRGHKNFSVAEIVVCSTGERQRNNRLCVVRRHGQAGMIRHSVREGVCFHLSFLVFGLLSGRRKFFRGTVPQENFLGLLRVSADCLTYFSGNLQAIVSRRLRVGRFQAGRFVSLVRDKGPIPGSA